LREKERERGNDKVWVWEVKCCLFRVKYMWENDSWVEEERERDWVCFVDVGWGSRVKKGRKGFLFFINIGFLNYEK